MPVAYEDRGIAGTGTTETRGNHIGGNLELRIATEALNNVVRHSKASKAVEQLRHGKALEIEIVDDGTSLNGAWREGSVFRRCGKGPPSWGTLRGWSHAARRKGLRVTAPSCQVTVIKVLIADDHPVVRTGLSALLTSLEGIEVAGVPSTGREAVDSGDRDAQVIWSVVAHAVDNGLDWLILTFGNERAASQVEEKWATRGNP
jgi:hypothetical protein